MDRDIRELREKNSDRYIFDADREWRRPLFWFCIVGNGELCHGALSLVEKALLFVVSPVSGKGDNVMCRSVWNLRIPLKLKSQFGNIDNDYYLCRCTCCCRWSSSWPEPRMEATTWPAARFVIFNLWSLDCVLWRIDYVLVRETRQRNI